MAIYIACDWRPSTAFSREMRYQLINSVVIYYHIYTHTRARARTYKVCHIHTSTHPLHVNYNFRMLRLHAVKMNYVDDRRYNNTYTLRTARVQLFRHWSSYPFSTRQRARLRRLMERKWTRIYSWCYAPSGTLTTDRSISDLCRQSSATNHTLRVWDAYIYICMHTYQYDTKFSH